jgi:TonB-dependent receptor
MNHRPASLRRLPAAGRLRPLGAALFASAAVAAGAPAPAAAPTAAADTGTVAGRVLNAADGMYLDQALVRVDGTTDETLTDQSGSYVLSDLPAGPVTIDVSYTGKRDLTRTVTVASGVTTMEDFQFPASKGAAVNANGVVVLDQFTVQAQKAQTAAAIAINDQRNSINVKDVVSAGQFGDIIEGNVGDFVKYLPGVTIGYGSEISAYGNAADAQSISIRGIPSNMVPIEINGMPVADAALSLTRSDELEQLSINNASEVELIKEPTPDEAFGTVAGVINLITKSAFEYAHPVLDWQLFLSMNSEDTRVFKREPGPANKDTFHTLPGFSLSYILPFNDKFGITVSATSSNQYNIGEKYTGDWSYVDKQGAPGVSPSSPSFYQARFQDTPRDAYRQALGITLDWRPTDSSRLSLGYVASYFSGYNIDRYMLFKPGSTTGSSTVSYSPTSIASTSTTVTNNGSFSNKAGLGQTIDGSWHFLKGPWQIDAAGSDSISSTHLDSAKDGYISDYTGMSLTNISKSSGAAQVLSGIQNSMPTSISVFDKNGAPIDYTQIANYTIPSAIYMGSSASKQIKEALKIDVRRDLDFLPFHWMDAAVKVGAYATSQETEKYGAGESPEYDLTTLPADVDISDFLDTVNTGYDGHFGAYNDRQQWLDPYKFYQFFVQNPGVYTLNQAAAFKTYVYNQENITENDLQYYWMLDTRYLHNRLHVVLGQRADKAYSTGHVPYDNSSAIYERNPDGSFTIVNNKRVEIPNLTALQLNQLQYLPLVYQSTHNSQKPESILDLGYNLTSNLIAQINYSRTYGPQNYNSLTQANNGQPEIVENAPNSYNADGSVGEIVIPNPGLPPEVSDNLDYQLSYYTKTGGDLSVDFHTKKIRNYTYTTTTLIGDNNLDALPNSLSLDPADFINYDLITTNIDPTTVVHQYGWEFDVSQNLGFIPAVGKYFTVFGNTTTSRNSGVPFNADGNQPNDQSTASAGGVTFSSHRLVVSLKFTNSALQTLEHTEVKLADGTTTYVYQAIPATRRFDLDADYQLTRKLAFFVAARNIFNAHQKTIWYGPGIPTYAIPESDSDFGVQINFGIHGTF